MSVVLIYPPNYYRNKKDATKSYGGIVDRWRSVPPLGLLYIASSLLKNGIDVHVLDFNTSKINLEESIELIKTYNPKVIGITATSFQLRGAFQLAESIRKEFGSAVFIGLGGAHITVDPDFINRFPEFDFVVVGDGETTFPKLVDNILQGENIKGIFYGEQSTTLDDIPFPARQFIDMKKYYSKGQEFATILSERGCPYNCIFCSIKGISQRKVRFRTPKRVVDEIEEVVNNYGIRRFWFIDDAITLNENHTFELCEEIIKRNLKIIWWCETRVENVTERLIKIMRKAGCITISFGIESGSEEVRKIVIRKNFTNEQAINAFRICKENGISTEAYLMLGFPTETKEQMYETAKFSLQLKADIIGVHVTTPYPGSDLFKLAVVEGYIEENVYDKYTRGILDYNLPVYLPKGVSLSEIKTIQKEIYRKFYFRPGFIISRLKQDIFSFRKLKEDAQMAMRLFMKWDAKD